MPQRETCKVSEGTNKLMPLCQKFLIFTSICILISVYVVADMCKLPETEDRSYNEKAPGPLERWHNGNNNEWTSACFHEGVAHSKASRKKWIGEKGVESNGFYIDKYLLNYDISVFNFHLANDHFFLHSRWVESTSFLPTHTKKNTPVF